MDKLMSIPSWQKGKLISADEQNSIELYISFQYSELLLN